MRWFRVVDRKCQENFKKAIMLIPQVFNAGVDRDECEEHYFWKMFGHKCRHSVAMCRGRVKLKGGQSLCIHDLQTSGIAREIPRSEVAVAETVIDESKRAREF